MNRLVCAAVFALSISSALLAQPLLITSTSPLPTGVAGQPYQTYTFTASGGYATTTWTATGLPTGLSLDSLTAQLTGTTGAIGTFPISVKVTDSLGVSDTKTFSLKINTAIVVTTSSPLPAATRNAAYSTFLAASGGEGPPYTWRFEPDFSSMPPGLTLNTSTGQISGTPTGNAGPYQIMVMATDTAAPPQTSSGYILSLTINEAPLVITSPQAIQRGVVGSNYSYSLGAAGGLPPYFWTLNAGGTGLPSGVSMSSAGVVSGTPSASGTFTFKATVTDASTFQPQAQSQDFSIVINPLLVITTSTLANGTRGTPYAGGPMTSTGGQPPVTWSVASGTVPNGLTLNSDGTITGTPTASGTFNFVARATDSGPGSANQVKTQGIAITVADPPVQITTGATLPSGIQGLAYNRSLTATGGNPPYVWSVTGGSLPPNFALSSGGVITGTTTATGTFTFTAQVSDTSAGSLPPQQDTRTFSVTIDPALVISSANTLVNGTQGSSYNQTLAAANGTSPYVNWTVTAGSLPAGITLNASTGQLSGTPTANGTSSFTVQVQDSGSPQQTATKAFTLTINVGPLTIITPSPLTSGSGGQAYSQTLSASGGVGPYSWALATGTLPSGITVNSSGVISGTTTQSGTFSFDIRVTDSANTVVLKTFSLTISPSSFTISTANPLPQGSVNTPYSTVFAATGGTTPLTWSVASGSLPPGLALASTGLLSGSPTQSGSFNFVISAIDSRSTLALRTYDLTIVVVPPSITTSSPLPTAIANAPYSYPLAAAGGTLPYSWLLTAGALPPGLTLSSGGVLAGTPTLTGSFSFNVRLTDGTGQIATKGFTIQVSTSAATITTASPLPAAPVGVPYALDFTAAGGSTPYSWAVDAGSSLPPGLILSTSGALSGTPTQTGTFNFSIALTDGGGALATKSFSLNVTAGVPVITTVSLPNGRLGVAYNQTLTAAGGVPPYFWDLYIGALPAGLAITSTGVIQGTPTQTGSFSFYVIATDNNQVSAFRQLSITIDASSLSISTATPLTAGTVGTAYSQQFVAVGGVPPYRWAVASGQLPTGLNFDVNTGVLSGNPTTEGAYFFTLQVTESGNSQTTTKAFTLVINAIPLTITTPNPLPTGAPNQPYSLQFTATGGTPPYVWTVESGALPAGLTLSSTGLLSGTPVFVGVSSFRIAVADSGISVSFASKQVAAAPAGAAAQFASVPFTLTIGAAPVTITTTSPLPAGTLNVAYSQTFTAGGGTPGYTWSLFDGSPPLPPGLTLTSGGVLSGTPTTIGNYNFIVQARDSAYQPQYATKSFSLQIQPGSVTITTVSPLPDATLSAAYLQQFAATGGVTPYVWSLASGTLPPGLTLGGNGILSGTPTAAGPFTFTVRVRDSQSTPLQNEKTFSLTVDSGFPVITTTILPAGQALIFYSTTLAASGGVPPYAFAVASGSLPTGFSLTTGGQLSGTASDSLSSSFTVRVTDKNGRSGTRTFSLAIGTREPPVRLRLEILTSLIPEGSVGKLYATSFVARNGTPPYHWDFAGLPDGFTGNAVGEVIGTPRRAGTFPIQVAVSDDAGERATSNFNLVIKPSTVIIVTERIPDGRVGDPYSTSFSATGGLPSYAFTIASGSLPPGTSLASNGVLSGTPTEPGTFQFTVQAIDATGEKGTKSFSAVIKPLPLRITTESLNNGLVGISYGATLAATGGLRPYRWSATGLPDGLSLDAGTGAISGTPSKNGSFGLSVQVADAGDQTTTKSFTIVITTEILITTPSLGNLIIGTPASISLSATGGKGPYSWTVLSGSLPSGLNLTAAGVITGSPTTPGDYSINVEVRDANNIPASKGFSGRVVAPLTITTETAPPAPLGVPYSLSLAATGGTQPYTWSITGNLPPGLALSGATISGTPTAPGTFNFTVQVADSATLPLTAQRPFTIQVSLPDVSGLNITLPPNPQPAQQQRITVGINTPYPVDVTGTLTLTFAPDTANNADDPAIQFSTGGRSVQFTIPAGQTQAVFTVADLGLQTGTTAGTITLTTSLTAAGSPINCNCQLNRTIVIPRSAPVITSLRVQRTATGFDVIVTGFSTSREVTQGTFRFAGTTNLQTTDLTVALTTTFNAWFQSQASNAFGGQFSLRLPFTIQGNTATVNSVTVTLTNGTGSSQPNTAAF